MGLFSKADILERLALEAAVQAGEGGDEQVIKGQSHEPRRESLTRRIRYNKVCIVSSGENVVTIYLLCNR